MFTTKIALGFQNIFPGEDIKPLDYYLDGIGKSDLINTSTFFLNFERASKYETPRQFVQMFFSTGNQDFAEKVWQNFMHFVGQEDYDVNSYSFPYVISSLKLLEYANDKDYDRVREYSTEEKEQRIFKAYLVLNTENTAKRSRENSLSVTNYPDPVKPIWLLIGLALHNYEVTNYDLRRILITQIIRALHFFEFLTTNEQAEPLIKKFYEYYDVVDFNEYLKRVILLTLPILTREKEAHVDLVINENGDKIKNIAFLEKFTIKDTDTLEDIDFRHLRGNPLIRLNNNTFRVTYPLFAIELIGNGLYFKLKELNSALQPDKQVKNLYGLKSFEFSEKYLLSQLLRKIFGKKYRQFSGDELSSFDGAPDYYVRNGNKIWLFESKDILINATVKHTTNIEEIDRELSLKLFENQKGSPKAVLQIINNIRKILTGTLLFDSQLKPKRAIVYPIIVVHNRIFNTPGINNIINRWYKEELSNLQLEGFYIDNMKSLIIVDIDTLLYNVDLLSTKKINCIDCLENYCQEYLEYTPEGRRFASREEAVARHKESFLSFGHTLENYIDSSGIRMIPAKIESFASVLRRSDDN